MTESSIQIQTKAERIRDVIRYIKKFKNATIVIYIDDKIISSPMFTPHIHDISLIKEAGLNVLIVPGAKERIDAILQANGISWKTRDGCRITDEKAIPLIKSAAFEVANIVMTSLAGERMTAVIGNWVRARGKGVISGIDFGTSGVTDRIDSDAIMTVLKDGFIPIFPCIGWSLNGKPYNISSVQLASQIAIHLQADKLFFLIEDAEIKKPFFDIPDETPLSPEGNVPAMNIEEVSRFLSLNESRAAKSDEPLFGRIISVLNLSKDACAKGVTRAHIINGSIAGTIPCEIFSDLGSGTMIYSSDYGKIRAMRREDISPVLSLIQPLVSKGILLPRTEAQLESTYNDYIIYEVDGAVRACSSLHIYDSENAEIAAVAVDETFCGIGIGVKMIEYLITKAKTISIKNIFALTTQTADWFESLEFKHANASELPEKRRAAMDPRRASKVYKLQIT